MAEGSDTKPKKRSGSRSPRFPAYTLETAIETVKSARKFGRTVTDAQIAGEGSTNSGSFIRKKAALGYYGLISGRGNDIYITDLAERIIHPKPDEEENAIRDAFLSPEIFKKLYSTTTKNAPIPLSVFGNILIRDHNIQPVAKNDFLSVFIRSGIFSGLINYSDDTKSDIVFLDPLEKRESTKGNDEDIPTASELPVYRYEDLVSPEIQTAEISLSRGKAKIVVPKELTSSDAKRLKAQIDILANIFD